ncbi:MAG: PAS domain S-box protein, partial [Mariprofundaceae bacterium]|nr:PAS domain S-box protein [Mariprofundaceae bacterium]
MILFDVFHIKTFISDEALAFLDAFCLIILATPLIYITIISPLIKKRRKYQRQSDILLCALDGASDCIMITNADGNVTYTNQAFTNITGYSAKEILGKNPRILQSGKQDKLFYKIMWNTLKTAGEWKGELWNRRKDGSEYLETLHIKKIHVNHCEKPYYIGIITDITLKKEHEASLAHT